MDNEPCVVRDAKTGEDITRSIFSRSFWKKRRGLPCSRLQCWPTSFAFTGTPCKVSWVVTWKEYPDPDGFAGPGIVQGAISNNLFQQMQEQMQSKPSSCLEASESNVSASCT